MKAKDEREELRKLLDKSPDEIKDNVPTNAENIPGLKAEPVTDVDFNELREKCEQEAEIMLKNAIKFIIPEDMIESNEYLENKLKVDIISLSGMIYQLRTNEVMQKALIDQVNLGMVNARMFEVFTGRSKAIGELNKQLIQTVEALKETYKSFREDVKEKRTEALGPQAGPKGMITTGDGGVITRGTKELINRVKTLNAPEGYLDKEGLIPNIDDAQLVE